MNAHNRSEAEGRSPAAAYFRALFEHPTFRGMRQSLMNTFDEIHVLNLHGNSLKKETAPDGGEDKNVFDIRQGVAICVMVKSRSGIPARPDGQPGMADLPAVRHADLWGPRKGKYGWLDTHQLDNTDWADLAPSSPACLFIPRDETALQHVSTYPSLDDITVVSGVGMTTARDGFVIDYEKRTLLNRVRLFKNSELKDEALHKGFDIAKKAGWSIRRG